MERTMKIILCGILTVALAAPALFAQSGTGQRGIRAARLAQIAQERKNEEEAAGGTTQPGGFGGISIAEKFKSRLAPDPGTETAEEPAEEAEPASVADRFKSRLAVNGWGGGTDEGQSGASRFETIGFNSNSARP